MAYDANARRAYKRHAREMIRPYFWPTMSAVLLTTIPMLLISMILDIGMDGISSASDITAETAARLVKYGGIWLALYFFVGSPLTFGAKHYFVARSRGEKVSVSAIFVVFGSMRKYVTSLKLALCIFIRSLVWIALLYAVSALAFLPASFLTGGLAAAWSLIYLALVIAVGLTAGVKVRRYDGAYICLIDEPDGSAWKATGACARIFKGHNWELFLFDLSFWGWVVLSVLTIGVVYIYYTAYHDVAFTRYFDALRGRT